jgi:MFS family permease
VIDVLRLSFALFLVQAGFHGFTASLPVALARGLVPDATIGLIVGSAAIVQIPVAIAGGRLLDRFGGLRLFAVGGIAYLLGTAVMLLPGVEPGGSALPFVLARVCQGAGIGLTAPAAMSLVPRMLPTDRHGSGLAYVGAAQNLTGVLLPPISIAILDASSLHGVALALVAFVVAGLVLVAGLPARVRTRPRLREDSAADGEVGGRFTATGTADETRTGTATVRDDPFAGDAGVAGRRFGIAYRRAWTVPLAIVVCYVAHWGAVTAYLPVRAEQAGADIGLYFAADGLGIFLMRVASGRIVDRVPSRMLIATGAAVTGLAVAMLLLPITTPLLIVSGLVGGAGGAVVMTPVLLELSRRSSDLDRGSAFALFSGSLAVALTLGSIGGAPIVALFGLSAALAVGIVLIAVAIGLTLADPSLRGRGGRPGGTLAPITT